MLTDEETDVPYSSPNLTLKRLPALDAVINGAALNVLSDSKYELQFDQS
jgi:hypothetical protein